jgi:hypothetical protein
VKPRFPHLLTVSLLMMFAGCNAIWGISERAGLGPDAAGAPDVGMLQDARTGSDAVSPPDAASGQDAGPAVDARPDAGAMMDAAPDVRFCGQDAQSNATLCDDFEDGIFSPRWKPMPMRKALSVAPFGGSKVLSVVRPAGWTTGDADQLRFEFPTLGTPKAIAIEFLLWIEAVDTDSIQLVDIQAGTVPYVLSATLFDTKIQIEQKRDFDFDGGAFNNVTKAISGAVPTKQWVRVKFSAPLDNTIGAPMVLEIVGDIRTDTITDRTTLPVALPDPLNGGYLQLGVYTPNAPPFDSKIDDVVLRYSYNQ